MLCLSELTFASMIRVFATSRGVVANAATAPTKVTGIFSPMNAKKIFKMNKSTSAETLLGEGSWNAWPVHF